MAETKIQWPWKPLYAFNPITGCKRGCPWCYGRKNWNWLHRKRMGREFTDVSFWPERLKQRFKAGSHVFVGSMSDIEYWHRTWVRNVIDYCVMNPTVYFYFLSKNPLSYQGYDWPSNCCLGLTMTLTQTAHAQDEMLIEILKYPRTFLSIEPLLGSLTASCNHFSLTEFEWIIVGAMTGPGAIKPQPEWIESIGRPRFTTNYTIKDKIFWKPSMRGYVNG